MKRKIFAILLGTIFLLPLSSFARGKIVAEVVETALKKSGMVVNKAYKTELEGVLSVAAARYGDDVIKITKEAGLGALDNGLKYGDRFWELCLKYPDATKTLTLHADEFLPLSSRVGDDFLKLEAQHSGITKQIVNTFSEDVLPKLANHNGDDVIKLLHNVKKNPTQKAYLLERFLTPKNIVAGGAMGALLMIGNSVSSGVEYAFKEYPLPASIGTMIFAIILLAICSKWFRTRLLSCFKSKAE